MKPAVEKAVEEFAGRGFRSLGVARAEDEGDWQFVGMLPLFDPPREQAKATIASAKEMGVSVKMVTGDQIAIARETSKQLGLGTNIPSRRARRSHRRPSSPQCVRASAARPRCGTCVPPWYIVPADDNDSARLIVSQIVLDALAGPKMAYPRAGTKREAELKSIRKSFEN